MSSGRETRRRLLILRGTDYLPFVICDLSFVYLGGLVIYHLSFDIFHLSFKEDAPRFVSEDRFESKRNDK
jgi:hypothetical protein